MVAPVSRAPFAFVLGDATTDFVDDSGELIGERGARADNLAVFEHDANKRTKAVLANSCIAIQQPDKVGLGELARETFAGEHAAHCGVKPARTSRVVRVSEALEGEAFGGLHQIGEWLWGGVVAQDNPEFNAFAVHPPEVLEEPFDIGGAAETGNHCGNADFEGGGVGIGFAAHDLRDLACVGSVRGGLCLGEGCGGGSGLPRGALAVGRGGVIVHNLLYTKQRPIVVPWNPVEL